MERYSILDQGTSKPAPELASSSPDPDELRANLPPGTASPLRFPGEDGGKSLAEMAQRDLNVALQLLAERAQYITGASGAAIALRTDEDLICRARAGPSAPEVGAHLQVSSGLTGESVRTREVLRCNDAESDSRVNRESCQALGIASVMVMPLLREQDVVGVFELLSDRKHAFEERDIVALQRLGDMISTAIEHAYAVQRGLPPAAASAESRAPSSVAQLEVASAQPEAPRPPTDPSSADVASETAEPVLPGLANIRKCQACGFPVSGSRTLCLDCEAAQNAGDESRGSSPSPAFLAEYENAKSESWLRDNIYTIGIILMVVLTGVVLAWLRPI